MRAKHVRLLGAAGEAGLHGAGVEQGGALRGLADLVGDELVGQVVAAGDGAVVAREIPAT